MQISQEEKNLGTPDIIKKKKRCNEIFQWYQADIVSIKYK
jgi:hypothetical protein